MARPSRPFSRSDTRFRNVKKVSALPSLFPCAHDGPCDEACPCVQNKTPCCVDCYYGEQCNPEYMGCDCPGLCRSSGCVCFLIKYDCIPGRCGCVEDCYNRSAAKGSLQTKVRQSEVPAHGLGLFSLHNIGKSTYIGEYTGRIVLDVVYDSRPCKDNRVTAFQLTRRQLGCRYADTRANWHRSPSRRRRRR